MKKDFQSWHILKSQLHENKSEVFFHEREIWWCTLGANIGFEQDGRGEYFDRPVLVLKKFNLDICLIVPLTTSGKKGKYYFPLGEIEGKNATAVLSQIRLIDRKRLMNKVYIVEEKVFNQLVKKVVEANFYQDIP